MTKEKTSNRLREKPIPTRFRDQNDWELYVNNFPTDWKERDLKKVFEPFNCTRVRIKNKEDKVFGFATFREYTDAETAYTTLDGNYFDRARLNIQFARSSIAPEELVKNRLEKTQFSADVKSSRTRSSDLCSNYYGHSGREVTTPYSETPISNQSQEDGRVGFASRAELSSGVEFSAGVEHLPRRQTSTQLIESYSGAAESRNSGQQNNDKSSNRTHGDISSRTFSNHNSNQRYADANQFSSSESEMDPSNSTEQRGRKHSETDGDVNPSNYYGASRDIEQQRKKTPTNESLCRNTNVSKLPENPEEGNYDRVETAFRCSHQQTDSFARLEFSDVEFKVCTKQAIYVRDYALLEMKIDAIWNRTESSAFGRGQPDRFKVTEAGRLTPPSRNSVVVVEPTNAGCADVASPKGVSPHRSCCETMPDSMGSGELQRMIADTKLKVGYLQYEDLPEKLEILVVHVCDSNHFWGSVVNSEKLMADFQGLFQMMSDFDESWKPEFQLDRATAREKRVGVVYGGQDWCRGWIKSRIDSTHVDVFYIDYGNSECRSNEELFVLPRKCWLFQPLAHPFHLTGIVENGWLESCTNKKISFRLISPQPENIGFVLAVGPADEEPLQ